MWYGKSKKRMSRKKKVSLTKGLEETFNTIGLMAKGFKKRRYR